MTPSRRTLIALALAGIAGVAGAIAVRADGIRPVRITSGSMSPTIAQGDWIVAHEFDRAGRSTLSRGDIVLFRFPLGTSGRAIKRVVALSGDRVSIAARRITVNRRVIRIAGAPSAHAARERVETVPPNHVFLLGDNTSLSIDSRSFGAVPTAEIVGRQIVTIGHPGFPRLAATALLLGCLLIVGVGTRVGRPHRGLELRPRPPAGA
jgi:signal peptidase I